MAIFPLAPDQTIAQMWSNRVRGGCVLSMQSVLKQCVQRNGCSQWMHLVCVNISTAPMPTLSLTGRLFLCTTQVLSAMVNVCYNGNIYSIEVHTDALIIEFVAIFTFAVFMCRHFDCLTVFPSNTWNFHMRLVPGITVHGTLLSGIKYLWVWKGTVQYLIQCSVSLLLLLGEGVHYGYIAYFWCQQFAADCSTDNWLHL